MGKAKVLIVDDHIHLRQGLKGVLEAAGYQVVSVLQDADRAVNKAVQHRPDIILMDVRLPHSDGYQAARRIRAAGLNSHIIFMVNFHNKASRQAVAVPKEEHVFVKGYDIEELLELIEELMHNE